MKITLKLLIAFICFPYSLFAQAWIAKHGMSPADYQTAFTDNYNKGYRLSAVSGYTSNGQEKYIALWEKTAGVAWVAKHGMSAADYQTAFNTYANQGYRLTSISGYAVNNVVKFAAIWEKKAGGAWTARHNMTAAEYQTAFNDYAGKGYRLQHISGYVVNGTEYFAGIWEVAAGGAWTAKHNLTAAQYQTAFTDLTSQGYVLKKITGYAKNGTDLYAAIWEKTASPLWSARHGISSVNYQHVVDNMYYQGYRPELLNAFASGSSAKFNTIWTNVNMLGADIAKIDAAANGYMSSQNVTGMSLAICKDGRLVFAKGYGYANPATAEEMSPNHSLRIMSISKPVTAVGVMTLIEKNKIATDQFVFGANSILGSKYPTPAGKQKLNNIRVRDLLWHTSGLKSCNGESVFWDDTKNADDAMNVLLGEADLIHNSAGMVYEYSNTNYFILARIIEIVSGQSYETYIRQNVLNKCGIGASMYLGQASGNINAGEAHYTPMSNMNLQLWGGFGGWVAKPMDLLSFLNHVDGQTGPADIISAATHTTMTTGSAANPGYAFGWNASGDIQNHNGCYGSSRSFLVELGGGISYSVIINSQPSNDGCGWTMKAEMEAGLKKVSGYPAYNLFPNNGTGLAAPEVVTSLTSSEISNNVIVAATKVIAYPNPSSDGVIRFTNAETIKSVIVTDMIGHTETYAACTELHTQLKGILILRIETATAPVVVRVKVD